MMYTAIKERPGSKFFKQLAKETAVGKNKYEKQMKVVKLLDKKYAELSPKKRIEEEWVSICRELGEKRKNELLLMVFSADLTDALKSYVERRDGVRPTVNQLSKKLKKSEICRFIAKKLAPKIMEEKWQMICSQMGESGKEELLELAHKLKLTNFMRDYENEIYGYRPYKHPGQIGKKLNKMDLCIILQTQFPYMYS